MDENEHRMSALGRGFLRLWTEMQIWQERKINAATMAREASVAASKPVAAGAPWSIVLGGGAHSPLELARLVAYLGCESLAEVEQVGNDDWDRLQEIVESW